MKLFGTKQTTAAPATLYATSADFCRIFQDDMDHLYRLSLLLTADSELAEQCFVRGLEDSKTGNPVFREWAQSWARRTIISNAIRMVRPRPDQRADEKGSDRVARSGDQLPTELLPVLDLEAFERFVFVMSVLEGYNDRDCKLLLDCSVSDVVRARARAMQHVGFPAGVPDTHKQMIEASSKADNRRAGIASAMRPPLAVSA